MSTPSPTDELQPKPQPQEDNLVELETPVRRGQSEISSFILRRPKAGELRGLHLSELLQLDVASLIKLVPRISPLNEFEVSQLDPADLVAVGMKVSGFLLQKQMKTDASLLA
ncbi:phage tail assembly protein [Pseudomonas cremoricolorata]|uniref:phage tail assembly protein n=1 Tax=Pseudomonas cremoricolorata TaxID=157783 RepID=UPI00040EAFBA|nr:phage tail assembly protein [Pseudomonas cremoricolorata]